MQWGSACSLASTQILLHQEMGCHLLLMAYVYTGIHSSPYSQLDKLVSLQLFSLCLSIPASFPDHLYQPHPRPSISASFPDHLYQPHPRPSISASFPGHLYQPHPRPSIPASSQAIYTSLIPRPSIPASSQTIYTSLIPGHLYQPHPRPSIQASFTDHRKNGLPKFKMHLYRYNISDRMIQNLLD